MQEEAANQSDYGEEGEMEISEMGEEEGEHEMDEHGESEDEEIPDAVPIEGDTIDHTAKQEEESSISDIDVDDYGSSSEEYDSDELNMDSTANPHGFVYSNMLETFQKSRKERIQ